ncbi:MAG: 6-pyruvoyl trahydropterin synthase family protein [Candidatus Hodarchaeales archaeon]
MVLYSVQLYNKYKISSAHFVIAKSYQEPVHGHNFEFSLKITANRLDENQMVIDFFDLDPLFKKLVNMMDHRLLLPVLNPELDISHDDKQVEFHFRGKHYIFPAEDVALLPIRNGTVEELARYVASLVKERVISREITDHLVSLTVTVSEYGWQAAKCKMFFNE